MKSEPVVISCPGGHSFFAKKLEGEPVSQEMLCPACGRRLLLPPQPPIIR